MNLWLLGIVAILILYLTQVIVILLGQRRKPRKLAAWLCLSLSFPVIGFIGYLFIGRSFGLRSHTHGFERSHLQLASAKAAIADHPEDIGNDEFAAQHKLFRLLTMLPSQVITLRNRVIVLMNGEETFAAIERAISKAQHHIHMDYYTIRDDGIGRSFLKLLVEKARAGIEVRVMYDGIGSIQLSDRYVEELKAAGAQVSCFLPPRIAFYDKLLNNRNHSKITVVDGVIGFLGGINIGDEYLGKDQKLGFWRDTHLQLEGDAVYYLQELFMKDWAFSTHELLPNMPYMPAHQIEAKEAVVIISGGPDRTGDPILETAFAVVTAAESRIDIATPYFIPDEGLLMALRAAAMSGVVVRMIIPGIGDTQLVLWATLSYVERLLEAGVQVYRYQKGFIHSKVMLIDEMLATVGTANMDMRSFYSNFEQNAVLFDSNTIQQLRRNFEQDLLDSVQLELDSFRHRPMRQKAAEAAAQLLSPLL